MSTVRETAIERAVVHKAAKELGVFSTKMGTTGSTGWPDRIFFIPGGRPLMIEFKRPGGKMTEKQKWVHERLRWLGYDVEVHDDTTKALQTINYYKQRAVSPR